MLEDEDDKYYACINCKVDLGDEEYEHDTDTDTHTCQYCGAITNNKYLVLKRRG